MNNKLLSLAASVALFSIPFAANAAAVSKTFSKADKNGDGKLSKEEFVAMGKGKTEASKTETSKAEAAFAKKDKDKDGFLSLEEFSATAADKKEGGAADTVKPKRRKR